MLQENIPDRPNGNCESPVRNPIAQYLYETGETPLLSAQEEHDLAVRVQEGDAEARDHMIRANLRLVVNIARGYTGKGLGLQDLIEEGNIGLMRGIDGFDPAMGTRLSTYASYWIKQSIKIGIINKARTIRIPAYMVDLVSNWRRTHNGLNRELGRTPTFEEIANELGVKKKQYPQIKTALRLMSNGKANGNEMLEHISSDELPHAQSAADRESFSATMEIINSALDHRERMIIISYFGLDGKDRMTLEEISKKLGITRERVRQIKADVISRLRDALE